MSSRKKTGRRTVEDAAQSADFIDKARELGADEVSSVNADMLIRRLARKPPDPHTVPRRKNGRS
jgi:hypothetical protein